MRLLLREVGVSRKRRRPLCSQKRCAMYEFQQGNELMFSDFPTFPNICFCIFFPPLQIEYSLGCDSCVGRLLMWQKQMEWRNSSPTPAAIQGLILLPPSLQFAHAWKRWRTHCYSLLFSGRHYLLPSVAPGLVEKLFWTQRAKHNELDTKSKTHWVRQK